MNDKFNSYLKSSLNNLIDSNVKEAMLYSLLAGGKRLRPKLIFAVLNGYKIEENHGYPYAAALEMIHTYSLIHDDLPAMDNDDLRRGKKTCHKQFNEATAILAGDGLLTYTFETVISTKDSDQIKTNIVKVLAECSGSNGMIYGQELDTEAEDNSDLELEDLKKIHLYKTGKLFIAALKIGAIIANKYDDLDVWEKLGEKLGLAFQIQDDILDEVCSSEQLGKTASDKENNKLTTVSLLGLTKANILMNQIYDECYTILDSLKFDKEALYQLIEDMRSRLN